MKKWKNEALRVLKSEDVKNFDDVALLLETSSKSYQALLREHFRYQKMVEDNIIKEVYPTAKKISSALSIDEKTVHRFNKDMSCVVFKRCRWKNGKQTSNLYKMNKTFYAYMKAFWRLGLFKDGIKFKERWEWIKKMWLDCGSNHNLFMNKVWNHSSLRKKESCKQPTKKMSVGDFAKCPSISNSLSSILKCCTDFVPFEKIQEMERLLENKVRLACEDLRWYTKEKGNKVFNYAGFFANALKRTCSPKSVFK